MPNIGERFSNAWNAFVGRENAELKVPYGSYISTEKPDRIRLKPGNERTIVTAIWNRIALDVSATRIEHVKLDEFGRYSETVEDGLNNCLTLDPNLDQISRAFYIDVVMSMFDEGTVAIVPINTKGDPYLSDHYDILSMRTGKILQWYPSAVRVEAYNEDKGIKEERIFDKSTIAIIENPFYSVMNSRNSVAQRLLRKLAILDAIDEQSGSGKLDLIIQLPYVVRSEQQKHQAEERRKDIERQLAGTKYGIAYTSSTERITQLNRAVENNLMSQIEYLTSMLYSQLGITQGIMDGSAPESEMLNYMNRTIEPILSALTDEMKRKFLTKTARSQGHSIFFYRDPFRLVTAEKIADIGDKFTRNEIMTSNEMRQIIGMKPSTDPEADVLRNKNLNKSKDQEQGAPTPVFDDKQKES